MPTDPIRAVRAVAYLNHGRWVAVCPRPGCGNAEQFGNAGQADGSPGGLRGDAFECRAAYGGCGLVCGVDWPPNIADIEAIVMARPAPATRNWHPGEDLLQMLRENLENGLTPGDDLDVYGDRITAGALTGWSPRQIERADT